MSEFKDVETNKQKGRSIFFWRFILKCTSRQLSVWPRLREALEGVQQTVDAADQLVPLAGQRLVALHVGLLLHFACHQPLRLLAGAVHQFLHLHVQLLHLTHLWSGEEAELY